MSLNKPNVYEKSHSFNGFSSHNIESIEIQKKRAIALLKDYLSSDKVDNNFKNVLNNVLNDLTGTDNHNIKSKLELTQYIADEMSKINDADIPRYLYHRYRYDVYPLEKILDDFPPYVQIEPTSVCNYRCVFCYQTDDSFINKANGFMGQMKFELFKSIVDKLVNNVEFISLSSRGEPLVCKDIDKMLEYCSDKFLGLKMNTNASLLNEKHAHAILSGGVQTLVISADAAEEPLYSQLRVNGSLDKVVKNLELFHNIKEKHYPESKLITRVSGVYVNDEQSFESMNSFWSSMVDQIAFVKYNPWENVYDSKVNDITTPCSDLWRRMFLWFDGKVNPCDTDYKSTLSPGNIKDSDITGIWRSEHYNNIREAHLDNRRSGVEPCKKCVVI